LGFWISFGIRISAFDIGRRCHHQRHSVLFPTMSTARRGPRFLITRLSAVGDCIFTLPVACALRRHFPEAFIGWVVEPLSAGLVRPHDCLDEVIVVPRRWWKSPRTAWELRRKLRSLAIDTAIDVQSLNKSAMAAWLSGAKQRIGFARPWGRELSLVLNNVRVREKSEHVVDAYLELLAPLGIESPQVEFRIPEDAAARTAMASYREHELHGQPFAVINPGASWNSKLWPIGRYAEVARHLGTRHGVRSVVIWYGDSERAWAEEIVAGASGHSLLARPTTLNEVAALARQARLFISSDTGPLHLAAAVGTPCVAMYGPTPVGHCGPYGPQHIALQAYYQDGTRYQRRAGDNRAMQAITVEQVCAACDEILLRSTVTDRAA
jgi:lipopolysaccharide heptosyltransferase I